MATTDKTPEQIAADEAAARIAADKAVLDAAAKEAASTAAKEKVAADAATVAGKARKPFTIIGKPGFPFNVEGEGFGADKKGILIVSGRVVETTKWNDVILKGQMPADIKTGVVTITRGDGTEIQTGIYKA